MSAFDRRPLWQIFANMLIQSRCSLLIGQFFTSTRTWQNLLCRGETFHVWSMAICACLPCKPPRQSILSCPIYLAYLLILVRRGRRSNTYIWFPVEEAQNIAVLWWRKLAKMELFGSIFVSPLRIYSVLKKSCVEMAKTKKYSSFNEQRYHWFRVNCVEPFIIIILIGRINC